MRVEQKEEPSLSAGKQKKPEKFVPAQPIGKVATLMALAVVATALFWLAWHNALSTGISLSGSTDNVIVVASTLLAFCLMFCMLAAAEMLITRKLLLFIMAFAAAGTMFVFFAVTQWSIVGFLLMSLGFLYWRHEIHADAETRTKFVPHRTVGSSLKTAVALVLLAGSFVYYSSLSTGGDAAEKVTESLVNTGTSVVESVLRRTYGEQYDPMMELDAFIMGVGVEGVEKLIPAETGYEQIDAVIEEGIETAKTEAVIEIRTELLDTFGIAAEGDDSMRSVVSKVVLKNIEQYTEPYIKFVPALMAIGLFLVLNIFSFIYRELIKSFAYLVFNILVWIKFIRIEKAHVEVEKVTL
ncbi:MAG: hypothetical protein WC505_05410 [Patescibacteria group bacterium]